MKITVLYFASYRAKTGIAREDLEVPNDLMIKDFKEILVKRYPSIAPLLPNALVAVNQQYGFDSDPIPGGAEVAIFPPVSGGVAPLTVLKITHEPLGMDDLVRQITNDSIGAVCVFSGMVRGRTDRGQAHETTALEYEAFIPMAEAKMALVAEEIRDRWPLVDGIVIVQRIGRLAPGTPTVLIACAAAHRDTGVFEAARYGIDRLKEIVPIWKKEIGPNGEVWVEGHYHPVEGD